MGQSQPRPQSLFPILPAPAGQVQEQSVTHAHLWDSPWLFSARGGQRTAGLRPPPQRPVFTPLWGLNICCDTGMNRLHETKMQMAPRRGQRTRLPGRERNANGSRTVSKLAYLDTGTGTMPSVAQKEGTKLKCMCPLQLLPTPRSLSRAVPHLGILLRAAHTGQVCRQSSPRSCLLFGAEPKARKPAAEPW